MKGTATPGAVFVALGVVFIAVGSSGQRAFLAVGAAFVVIGFVSLIRRRRGAGPGK